MEKKWKVYLLECLDGSFYTGITNDIEKRIKAHSSGKGSKYVAKKGVRRIIAEKEMENRSVASKAEYEIKQLSREDKIKWFN